MTAPWLLVLVVLGPAASLTTEPSGWQAGSPMMQDQGPGVCHLAQPYSTMCLTSSVGPRRLPVGLISSSGLKQSIITRFGCFKSRLGQYHPSRLVLTPCWYCAHQDFNIRFRLSYQFPNKTAAGDWNFVPRALDSDIMIFDSDTGRTWAEHRDSDRRPARGGCRASHTCSHMWSNRIVACWSLAVVV